MHETGVHSPVTRILSEGKNYYLYNIMINNIMLFSDTKFRKGIFKIKMHPESHEG
jgi:hypothetical protein